MKFDVEFFEFPDGLEHLHSIKINEVTIYNANFKGDLNNLKTVTEKYVTVPIKTQGRKTKKKRRKKKK
jgi:hypothetical protein